jgi:hypothetical protein
MIEFFSVQSKFKKTIRKNSYLQFYYKHENATLAETVGTNPYSINLNNFSNDYCSFIVHGYGLIDGLRLRLLSAWYDGITSIKWTDFTSFAAKQSWQHACLSWQCEQCEAGKMVHKQPNNIVNIPGLNILTEQDFYCYIGEAVLGYRGYMGQDLVGFNECLTDAVIHFKTKIEFNIINSMDLFYRKHSFFTENFILCLKRILSDLGCKLNLK